MPSQAWTGLLNQGVEWTGAGTALSSAATATLSPQPSSNYDFPIQNGGLPYGWYDGLVLEVEAAGFITTTATSGTLTFFLAANTTNGSGTTYTTLATAAALTTGATVRTGIQWSLRGWIRCTAIASSGNTVSTWGEMWVGPDPATSQTINTATAGVNLHLPNASGPTAAAINTAGASPPLGIAFRCTQATSACTVQLSNWYLTARN